MMRYSLLLSLLLSPLMSIGQGKLTKIKLEKELEIKVPASFTKLTSEEILNKYLSSNAPLTMYGNQERTVDFGITKSPTRWTEKDSGILLDFYKSSITSTYTEVLFDKEELEEIDDQIFIVLEFTSIYKDTGNSALGANGRAIKKYTYLAYAVREGGLYVFNFNAPARERTKWKTTANAILKTVKFL